MDGLDKLWGQPLFLRKKVKIKEYSLDLFKCKNCDLVQLSKIGISHIYFRQPQNWKALAGLTVSVEHSKDLTAGVSTSSSALAGLKISQQLGNVFRRNVLNVSKVLIVVDPRYFDWILLLLKPYIIIYIFVYTNVITCLQTCLNLYTTLNTCLH